MGVISNIREIVKKIFKEHGWPFLLYFSIGFTFIIIIQQDGKQLFGSDVSLNSYGSTFSEEILQTGNFPYWNPYINGGMPHLSALTSTMFLPSYLVMYLLKIPIQQVFLYSCAIAIIFLGFFMYLFIRSLGLSKLTAFLAGVFFCLSGSFFSYINPGHDVMMLALVFVPIAFYFVTKGFKKDKAIYYILAGCMLGLQPLTMMFQITFYTSVCLTAYFLFLFFSEKMKFKHLFYFLLTGIFVVLISAVQLVQSLEYLKYSFRTGVNYEFFSTWSFHPLETIVYLYPKFFGFLESTYWGHSQFWLHSDYLGILPLIFAFGGIFFVNKNKTLWFFLIMGVCVMVLAFGGFTPLHKLLFKIPIVNGFRNSSRWLGLFSFSLIVVASFGLQYIINYCHQKVTMEQAAKMKKFLLSLLVAVGVAFLIFVVFASNRDAMAANIKSLKQFSGRFQPQHQDYVSQILYLMIKEDMLLLWVHLLIGFAIIYMTVKGWFGRGLFLFAAIIFVIMDSGILFMQEHVYDIGENQFKVQCVKTEPAGKDDPRRFEISKALKDDISLFRVMPVGDLNNKNWFTADHLQSLGGYHNAPLANFTAMNELRMFSDIRFLSLFNVKYFIAGEMINHPNLKLVHDGGVKIYQNTANLPRAFLSSKVVKVVDSEIAKKFQEPGFVPTGTIFLSEDMIKPLDNIKYIGNEVKISDFQPNRIMLETESKGNSMLFLSEVYYPKWKAYVDGEETKIYQAFGLFRSVYLPKGKHKIEFIWDSKTFYLGALTSLATLVFVFIFIILSLRQKK